MKTPVSDGPETMTENHPAYARGSDQRVAGDVVQMPLLTRLGGMAQQARDPKSTGGFLQNPQTLIDDSIPKLVPKPK